MEPLLLELLKLAVFGFFVWLITLIKMHEIIKSAIVGIAVIAVIYYVITHYAHLLG